MANDLRRQAISLLARREHTRVELARKLASHGSEEEIMAVLAELESSHLQSDSRAAESYLRSHGGRFGSSRLRQDLNSRGVAADLIAAQLAPGVLPDEIERARQVLRRKFAAAPADAREWARQARFLQGRGFAVDLIRRLLQQPAGEPQE